MPTYITSRQSPLTATVDGTVAQLVDAKIPLPPGAQITDVTAAVVSAATGTTPTLTMVDNAGSPNTYLSAVALGVANVNFKGAAAEVGNVYPAGAELSFTAGGTTPAGGRIVVSVSYIVLGRSSERFGPVEG